MTFLLREDGNSNPIPLLTDSVPLAVTRKTDLTTSADDIVTLNAKTTLIRVYAESYNAYIYYYGTDRTDTVSTSVWHDFIPAGQVMDFLVPANTTKITGIADGACPIFIVKEVE